MTGHKKPAQMGAAPTSLMSTPSEILRWGRYNGLRNVARQVFLDRNAVGFKKVDKKTGTLAHSATSERIREETRPHLRQAIHHVRLSRDALLADDVSRHEHMRDVARMHMAQAGATRKQPFMEEHRRAVEGGKGGGRKSNADEWVRLVREKMARNGALSKTDAFKQVAASWWSDQGSQRSWTTIRDAVNAYDKKKAK